MRFTKLFKCGLNRSWYRGQSVRGLQQRLSINSSAGLQRIRHLVRYKSTCFDAGTERVAHSGVQGITGLMLSNPINPPRSHHCVIKVGHQSRIDRSIPRTGAFVGSVRQSCRNSCGPGTQLFGQLPFLRLILAKPSRNGRVNQQGAIPKCPAIPIRTDLFARVTTPASPTFRFRSQAELRPVAIRQLPIPHRRAQKMKNPARAPPSRNPAPIRSRRQKVTDSPTGYRRNKWQPDSATKNKLRDTTGEANRTIEPCMRLTLATVEAPG